MLYLFWTVYYSNVFPGIYSAICHLETEQTRGGLIILQHGVSQQT